MREDESKIQISAHGSPTLPTLIYLPGIHGDWTLVTSFRQALAGRVRLIEITYPRTIAWSLEDYARGIETALRAANASTGWLIGESFGSQPAWAMIDRSRRGESPLTFPGLILAGGFVKHPWPWGAKLLGFLAGRLPRMALRGLLRVYAAGAKFRHRHAPETLSNIAGFVQNRLHPSDPPAIRHRFTLVAECDVRPIAGQCGLPVFYLAGLVDPIVPAFLVLPWLRRNCPTFQRHKIIAGADHNVLGTAPAMSAETVLRWMERPPTPLLHPAEPEGLVARKALKPAQP